MPTVVVFPFVPGDADEPQLARRIAVERRRRDGRGAPRVGDDERRERRARRIVDDRRGGARALRPRRESRGRRARRRARRGTAPPAATARLSSVSPVIVAGSVPRAPTSRPALVAARRRIVPERIASSGRRRGARAAPGRDERSRRPAPSRPWRRPVELHVEARARAARAPPRRSERPCTSGTARGGDATGRGAEARAASRRTASSAADPRRTLGGQRAHSSRAGAVASVSRPCARRRAHWRARAPFARAS